MEFSISIITALQTNCNFTLCKDFEVVNMLKKCPYSSWVEKRKLLFCERDS